MKINEIKPNKLYKTITSFELNGNRYYINDIFFCIKCEKTEEGYFDYIFLTKFGIEEETWFATDIHYFKKI
jgi:hypothetical protein